MRPKWLLLMVPAMIGIAALLLYGVGSPSSATVARVFSAGQWKVATTPGELRCALIVDLNHRAGPLAQAVVELLERLGEAGAQGSGPSDPDSACPGTAAAGPAARPRGNVTVSIIPPPG